jgi:hypothetical protein
MTSLNPGRYVPVGAFTSEIIQPSGTNLNTATRIPTYIGRGSRLIKQQDLQVSRAYINDAPVSFSATSPHTAALSPAAVRNKSMTIIVDSKAVAIRNDLWYFNEDGTTVTLADAAYKSGETYTISYQSADSSIGDPLPYQEIREISSVGTVASQAQFERNRDFYLSTAVLPVEAKTDAATGEYEHYTNATTVFTPVVHAVGTGTATVSLDTYAEFNHAYSRDYKLVVDSVAGSVVTFEWHATPVSAGNNAVPAVPLSSVVSAPKFTVDSTLAQSLTVALEFGVKVTFDFTSGSFAVGDVFTFSALAPALIEAHSAYANKNQFATATDVLADVDNSGEGTLVVSADAYTGESNLNVQVNVISVDPAVHAASVPTGSITLTGTPVDGHAFQINNGLAGAKKVVKVFEFDTDGIRSKTDSVLVPVTTIPAVAATSSISFGSDVAPVVPADGDVLVLNDGTATYTFEFDADNSLSNRSAIRVVIDTTANASKLTAANLVAAINSSAIRMTAVNNSVAHGALSLTANIAGLIGNASISYIGSAAVTIVQPTNGADASVDLVATSASLVSAVNSTGLGIVATADSVVDGKVNLIHGSRFSFNANPSDGDTVTVALGSSSVSYTFHAVASLPTDIAIGATATASAAALASKLALNTAYVTSSTGTVATVAHKFGRSITVTSAASSITAISSVADNSAAVSVGNVALAAVGTLSNVALEGMSGGVVAADAPDHITFAWGVAGDIFAGGVFTVAETDKATTTHDLVRNIKVKLDRPIATHAHGSILFTAQPHDGDTVTIADGLGNTVQFEFDSNSTVTETTTHKQVVIGSSVSATAANLVAKIMAATTALEISATLSGYTVSLSHDKTGAGPLGAYNTAITTTSSSLSVVGMTGGASAYAVGDVYTFTVKAPRKFPTALDNRVTELTVSSVGLTGTGVSPDYGYVKFAYESATPEGGFGSVTATTAAGGYFALPGQLVYAVRNTLPTKAGLNRFAVGDKFVSKFVNNEVIYWDLDTKVSESFTASDVLTDRSGSVTGAIGTLYLALSATPLAKYPVKVTLGGVAFDSVSISGNQVILTVGSISEITGTLVFSYVSKGAEPKLGTTYYITGNYLRPKSLYNTFLTYSSYEDARDALAPVTADNHLAIMNELAWSQASKPIQVGFVQILDSDDDGVLSTDDVTAALDAAATVSGATEITPIGLAGFLNKIMAFDEQGQDPFEKREHIMWYGFPIGTAIGDENTEGTLVNYAQGTLKSYGSALTHGRRVMVGHTEATKTITLYDGTTTTVTLDGSFINGAACALWAARPNNSTTLLTQNLLGFDWIKTYSDVDNNKLGAASIIWLKPNGTGAYQFMEDVTIDNSDPVFQSLLATGTKLDAERIVRREMDAGLVGIVVDNADSGVALVRTKLVTVLSGLVSKGITAPYQSADGSPRGISADDIRVYVDTTDPTTYNFFFVIYSRTVIKRLFGMYSVNKNLFLAGQ